MFMRVKRTDGPHKILIAYSGEITMWNELADLLMRLGYRVELAEDSKLGVSTTLIEMKATLLDIDFVILPLSGEDLEGSDLDIVRERIAHQVGAIKTILDLNGVGLFVDKDIAPLFSDSIIPEFGYNKYSIGFDALALVNMIEDELGPRIAREYIQKPFHTQLKDFEVKMGLLISAPILVLALVFLVSIFLNPQASSANIITAPNVEIDNPIEYKFTWPTFSSGTLVESNEVSCIVSTVLGSEFPAVTNCFSTGRLVSQGSVGPWHNQLNALQLDPNVSALVTYEDGSTSFFESGRSSNSFSIDPEKSKYGVDSLQFWFTGAGQKVYLYNTPNDWTVLEYQIRETIR